MATDELIVCLLVILFFTCCFPHRTVLCASMLRQGKVTWVWLERCCQRAPAWTQKPKWGSIPWFQLMSFFILLMHVLVGNYLDNFHSRDQQPCKFISTKGKCLHTKTVKLPQDWFGTPTTQPTANRCFIILLNQYGFRDLVRNQTRAEFMVFYYFSCVFVLPQDQYTALHIAVKHCKPQVVQILLGYGANVQHRGGRVRSFPSAVLLVYIWWCKIQRTQIRH